MVTRWSFMPIYSQICLLVSEEKIFKNFVFGCHGNQNSAWIYFIWAILIEDHIRIIYVKFYQSGLWFQSRCHLKQLLTMHDARQTKTGHNSSH